MQKATVACSIYIFDNSPCDERWMMKLGTRRTDGRGVSVTFFNSHWRLFISTSCKEPLRIFVSSNFFQCFRRRCSAVKNWVGDMVPWCCRQAHWNTSSETIGERTVWPSFFCTRNATVQGTLTCPTPPHPLPHILQAAEHQQRVQRTRNVNMPHPTPAPDPNPASCGTSTTCAMYKER